MDEVATPGRLANPPIQEALVDLRVVAPVPIDNQLLRPIQEVLRSEYPQIEEKRKFETLVVGKNQGVETHTLEHGFYGLFLKTEDGSRIAQFRVDGFTLSQLTGYRSGEALFEEALRLWDRYVAVVRPLAVIRIALRYINRVVLAF